MNESATILMQNMLKYNILYTQSDIYFIYNTLLTSNSITPDVTDYPGNSSFSINSLYLKIISIFDKTKHVKELKKNNNTQTSFEPVDTVGDDFDL